MKVARALPTQSTRKPDADSMLEATKDFLPKHRSVPLAQVTAEMTLRMGSAALFSARLDLTRRPESRIKTPPSESAGGEKSAARNAEEDEFYPLPAGLA